ncbi:E3 ubiquitin-protein ligase RNF123 [Aplysia californica]|uniref:E3 ubiquitin-protein ligase RNF123 n=1 Tax=Aplysia californica TaxID=6500 RepID=A0ABM1VZ77_APLCA|nr:E3 ubiquitin-protein ligase RNF123 [Aplysia californica]
MAESKKAAAASTSSASSGNNTRDSRELCRDTSPNTHPNAEHVRRSSRSPVAIDAAVSDGGSEDKYTSEILSHVFENPRSSSPVEGATGAAPSRKSLRLQTLEAHISSCLKEVSDKEMKSNMTAPSPEIGRLGPPECCFDIITNVGTIIVDPDRLGISSHSNFSSIKASCCVYEGKWVYELMLGSKGVMQLGWCTSNCRFSQEEGVGDTRDSYAYDGSRLRKWNVRTKRYGEPWMSGDVISCAIDCDEGTITFYRNGVSMGEAFSSVRVGAGYAYFPAVSLSFAEQVHANFGSLPLRYPIEGYRPLQSPCSVEVAQAELLFTYLHNLLPKMLEDDQFERRHASAQKGDYPQVPLTEQRSHQATLTLIASHVFQRLAPLLKIPYVIEMCLVKFLLGLCDHHDWRAEQLYVNKLLDLIWMLLQEPEIRDCMEHLMISLLNGYRFHSFHPEFKYPKMFLALTLAVLRHQKSRRHLLTYILFDRVKFPVFMHIKPPDDANMARLIPNVWWDKNLKKDDDDEDEEDSPPEAQPETPEEKLNKKKYMLSCDRLSERVEELESMQVELLKCLLINKDSIEGKTSRDCFLEKLKIFLKENSGFSRAQMAQSCALPVSLCFFHRLVQALRFFWDDFCSTDTNFLPSSEAFTPIQCFWSDSRDYFEFLRCGGLMSHLNRQLGGEVNRAQGIEVQEDGKVVKKAMMALKDTAASVGEDYPRLEMPSGNSLQDLLDAVVLLYHIAAHKQLGKMCALRESMQDFITNLQDTETKLSECPEDLLEVRNHLENARNVFLEKITEQARQIVWVNRIIYSPNKQKDMVWLMKVVLKTVEKASKYQKLFQYVPEFYIETAVNTFNALRNYLHPTTSFHAIPDLPNILSRYASFLVDHFFDSRIVSNDLKDTLVQALACFTCYPDTLKILEDLPMDRRISMIQSLISPYENRSWAHTNWILVRIWKGCGFGYRYRFLPNLIPHKAQPTEFSYVSLQKPCPSQEFQSLLAKILLDEEARSTKFLDSLMNQLNWSFSEFVGIIQEIQTLASRTESLLLESRQIKICAACFEISVCLLRILEMVATIAPQVFTDWSRPSAELFLKRLMQLLSQIMSRVTMKDGAFESTVALPIQGLDSVTFYPILTVTVGIMAQLIVRCGGSSQEKATRSLLRDSGFSVDSLKFVLGMAPSVTTATTTTTTTTMTTTAEKEKDKDKDKEKKKADKVFSFKKFDDISQEEIEDVEKLLSYLSNQQSTLTAEEENVREEDLCTICYANPQQTVFVPCGHRTCRTCITQQLLSKKECFFCIATITRLNDLKGRQILREYFQPAPQKK